MTQSRTQMGGHREQIKHKSLRCWALLFGIMYPAMSPDHPTRLQLCAQPHLHCSLGAPPCVIFLQHS